MNEHKLESRSNDHRWPTYRNDLYKRPWFIAPGVIFFLTVTSLGAQMMNKQIPETSIDHLIFTASSLEQGMDTVEKLLGIRPVPGGRHTLYGTHNALLALGEHTYLEVIAPDPDLPIPSRGRLFQHHYENPPKLATWALRCEDLDSVSVLARENGLSLGTVQAGSRTKADGSSISWRLSDPYALRMDGAIPFLISWGDTPHPASAIPHAGQLLELAIFHPEPALIQEKLSLLDQGLKVMQADTFRLRALIQTSNGLVVLE